MNQILTAVLFTFAFVVALIVGLREREVERMGPAAFRAKVQETILRDSKTLPLEKIAAPQPDAAVRGPASEVSPSSRPESVRAEPLNREAFKQRFGEHLQWTSYENRVTRIDGTAIGLEEFDSSQRIATFRPSERGELTSRGQEIFQASRRLVGAPADAEFLPPVVNPGESSGQVTFQQSEKGVPIYPGGLVTILVGSEGELRTLDSSVYPVIEVSNTAVIPMQTGARHILYVTQSSPVAVVNHAYESRDRGIQKVVDAQTGAILLERDRRIR